MKVLHLTTSLKGGAGIAANRLHKAFLDQNIKSFIISQPSLTSTFPNTTILNNTLNQVYQLSYNRIEKFYYTVKLHKPSQIFSSNLLTAPSLLKKIDLINPDIIMIHWVNGLISIPSLIKLSQKYKLVFHLHDMLFFTGGCHYSGDCQNYINKNCFPCPLLKKSSLSSKNFKLKEKLFSSSNVQITTPSKWLKNAASLNPFLKNTSITNIPNTLDSNIFQSITKNTARKLLSIPDSQIVIGYGALDHHDERKNVSILNQIPKNYLKLTMGSPTICNQNNTIHLGRLNDEYSKSLFYNSCDIFLLPSLQENFSNCLLESISCNTPVLGFNIGGNSDLIIPGITGEFISENISSSIVKILSNKYNARKYFLENFHQSIITSKFTQLFSTC